MLAHELPGTRHLDVVITGVTNEDRVIQLLIGDGQLQVAATSTKHIPTVPAVMPPFRQPEFTIAVKTMRGHVVWNPPRDLGLLLVNRLPARF